MGNSSSRTSPTLLGRLGNSPTDQAAWEAFVDRYGPKIYAWCQHWQLQRADAEDVTQAVLLKLARTMTHFTYDPGKSFRAWLKTVTRHAWADLRDGRKAGTQGVGDEATRLLLDSVQARDDLEARLEAEFDRELLEEATLRVRLRVSPDKWEVFRLLAVEGLCGAEVARRTGVKVATAYVVRGKVQKLLQEEVRALEAGQVTDGGGAP